MKFSTEHKAYEYLYSLGFTDQDLEGKDLIRMADNQYYSQICEQEKSSNLYQ